MLLASMALHGLVLFALLFVLGGGHAGNRTWGASQADGISATWLPGSGSGSGRQVDTAVPGAEPAASVEVLDPLEIQPAPKSSPLLEVIQRDPQSVFTAESDAVSLRQIASAVSSTRESVLEEMKSKELVQQIPEDQTAESRARTKSASGQGNAKSNDMPIDASDGAGTGPGGEGGDRGARKGDPNRIEFFGIAARGRRVVYVIDASESMRQHHAMELARQKLADSLQDLSLTSQFQILFFNLTTHAMNPSGDRLRLLAATSSNLRLAHQFLKSIQPDSGTDRFAAMKTALSLDPDVIYLLTDADDPPLSPKDIWSIKRLNKRNSIIHVVEFGIGGDLRRDSFLKTLARQNGGNHFYHDLTRADH